MGLPVAAGVDLPLLAYRDAVGAPLTAGRQVDGTRWVFLRDYVQLVRSRGATVPHEQVTKDEWLDLLAGRPGLLVDGVHDPDDPGAVLRRAVGVARGRDRLLLRLLRPRHRPGTTRESRPRRGGAAVGRAGSAGAGAS